MSNNVDDISTFGFGYGYKMVSVIVVYDCEWLAMHAFYAGTELFFSESQKRFSITNGFRDIQRRMADMTLIRPLNKGQVIHFGTN